MAERKTNARAFPRLRCRLVFVLLAILAVAEFPTASPGQNRDSSARWVDNTSGPMYTGTADVMPGGSFYVEPFYFNYRKPGGSNTSIPWKFAYGLGHKIEADLFVPLDYAGATPSGAGAIELGDTTLQGKFELHKEADRYSFRRAPSVGVSVDVNIPTGHLKSAKPSATGGSQTTNNTWNEQVNLLVRKQFKPFEYYFEATELVQNPVDVAGPYDFNNGLVSLAPGQRFHVVDGNVLAADATLEHVLIPRHGFGYLVEMNSERQSGHSLLFGRATAPRFSYLDLSPELETTWPAKGRFPVTWGAGVTFTAFQSDYQRQLIPMFTMTLNGNLHGGR
jgi:hypothetical protein